MLSSVLSQFSGGLEIGQHHFLSKNVKMSMPLSESFSTNLSVGAQSLSYSTVSMCFAILTRPFLRTETVSSSLST